MKYTFISCVEDNKFLEWFETLKNIPREVEIFILRNAPLKQETVDIVEAEGRTTMVIRERSEYVNDDIKSGIRFVKLRYDSIMITNPQPDEWISLGDDDMMFLPGYEEEYRKQILPILPHLDAFWATEYGFAPMSWERARFHGVRRGFHFRYNPDIIFEYGKYVNYYGGGEDSLLALLLYEHTTKSVNIHIDNVDHPGQNTQSYFIDRDSRFDGCDQYVWWVLGNLPQFQRQNDYKDNKLRELLFELLNRQLIWIKPKPVKKYRH